MLKDFDKNQNYYKFYKRKNIPIVFIHGVGLDHKMWFPQIRSFKNNSILVYDLLGHGKTPLNKKSVNFEDFSKQLKEGTKKSHTMAENTSFVASFLRGVVDESKYRQLVANFYFIYHALETEVEKNKDNPFVGPMRLNGLSRHDALIKDCEYFYGDDSVSYTHLTLPTKRIV